MKILLQAKEINMDKKEETNEEVKEMVTDMEKVKSAIQTCLNFEKEKGITLIHPKGRREFTELYRKDEPRRKFEQIIDEKIDAKLDPMNKKMDVLLKLMRGKIDEEIDELPGDK